MQGAKKGLIVNSTNLCRNPNRNRARADFTGQNGRVRRLKPPLRPSGCKEKRGAKRARLSHARLHRAENGGER